MKCEINFTETDATKTFTTLYNYYDRSEDYYRDKDLPRNIYNVASFTFTVNSLRMWGADTDVGTYNADGYTRIGYAKINDHEFVKNGEINGSELIKAVKELV